MRVPKQQSLGKPSPASAAGSAGSAGSTSLSVAFAAAERTLRGQEKCLRREGPANETPRTLQLSSISLISFTGRDGRLLSGTAQVDLDNLTAAQGFGEDSRGS